MKIITYQHKKVVDALLKNGEYKVTDINQMKTLLSLTRPGAGGLFKEAYNYIFDRMNKKIKNKRDYDQDIIAQDLIIDRVKGVNREGAKDLLLTQLFQTFYICTGLHNYRPEVKTYMKMITDMTYDFYMKYKDLWNEATPEQKQAKAQVCADIAKRSGYYIAIENYSIDMWLEYIKK